MNTNNRESAGRFAKGNTVGFQKGKSGNPNGRPPKDEFYKKLRKAAPKAIKAFNEVLELEVTGKNAGRIMEAVKFCCDHLYGKPEQSIDINANITATNAAIDAPPASESFEEWEKRHVIDATPEVDGKLNGKAK